MVPLTEGMVTAPNLARLTGKSVKTVYAWTARGLKLPTGERWHLPVAGLDHKGRRLYRLQDAQRAADAVAARGRSNADRVPT